MADPFAKKDGTPTDFEMFTNMEILHQGDKFILPANPQHMQIPTAIRLLEEKMAEENSFIDVSETVEALPWDGAVAFFRAMRDTFGWGRGVRTPPKNFFDSGSNPTYVSVKIGPKPNDIINIFWGAFKIPGVDGLLETGIKETRKRFYFQVQGTVKKSDYDKVAKLMRLTRDYAKNESIYRGKSIRFEVNEETGKLDVRSEPTFLDVSDVNPKELIFERSLETQIETNIFTPIKYTEACKKAGIPVRRGVLLEGPFGTGKTLTATVTAKMCEEHGWTFINVPRATVLSDVLEFAKLYEPAVVFCEDIDRVISGDRDISIDDILNTIDGVVSKTAKIITILTTNNVEDINQAMIRPGRLDAVISVRPPDAEAAARIIRVYSHGLLDEKEDLTEVGKEIEGQIPAVLREVVDRAKLYSISRAGDSSFKLTGSDLLSSAQQMKAHLMLLAPKPKKVTSDLAEVLGELVSQKTSEVLQTNGVVKQKSK